MLGGEKIEHISTTRTTMLRSRYEMAGQLFPAQILCRGGRGTFRRDVFRLRTTPELGDVNLIRLVAVVTCGLELAGCDSLGLPDPREANFDFFEPKPTTTELLIVSNPPGAEARTSLGAACRTPCTLPIISGSDFTVSNALNGYQPQTLKVHSSLPKGGFAGFSVSAPTVDPNPVVATLEPAAPPAKTPKPPKQHRRPDERG
jgi:hypothetical protein